MKTSKFHGASVILISLGLAYVAFCSIPFTPEVTTAGYTRLFACLFALIFLAIVALGIVSRALLHRMKKDPASRAASRN
jgi:hypothetical protein